MSNAIAREPRTVREVIAANLDAELTRARWTKRKAAAALGLSHVYVSRRASGEVELTGSDLAMFASFLGIPVTRFFVELPDLDSNQEPAGYGHDRAIVDLDEARKAREATASVDREHLAPVTEIRKAN